MAVPSSGQLRLNGDINLEINGTGTGTNVSLNGLSSEAGFAAPNGMTEFYGYVAVDAATVVTNAASSVTTSSMQLNGDVTGDGGGTISSRGFYFGTSSTYTSNTKYTVGSGTGAFSTARTGLTGSTTYYITAFAINEAGEVVGTTVSRATATPIVFTTRRFDIDECISHLVRYYYANSSNLWELGFSATGSSDQQRTVRLGGNSRVLCTSGTAISCNKVYLYSNTSGFGKSGNYAFNYGSYLYFYGYTNVDSNFTIT